MTTLLAKLASSGSQAPRPALTPRQVAHRLGLAKKNGRKTVERMLKAEEFDRAAEQAGIPGPFKVGRWWRIPPAVLEAYIEQSAARVRGEARARREGKIPRVPSRPVASQQSQSDVSRTLARSRG